MVKHDAAHIKLSHTMSPTYINMYVFVYAFGEKSMTKITLNDSY